MALFAIGQYPQQTRASQSDQKLGAGAGLDYMNIVSVLPFSVSTSSIGTDRVHAGAAEGSIRSFIHGDLRPEARGRAAPRGASAEAVDVPRDDDLREKKLEARGWH